MSEKLINKGAEVFGTPTKDRKQFIVVGVARGGTSMVAGAMANLGVYMGDRAVPPVYEDLRLSEAIEANDFEVARRIVEEYNSAHDIWGWKRPYLIDCLYDVDRLLDNAAYIFIFKDVFSIAKRNSISMLSDVVPNMEKSLEQYLKCISFIRNKSPYALLLSYDKAISYPEYFIDILIKFCGLTPSDQQKNAAIEFINPESIDYLDGTRITKARGRLDGMDDRTMRGWAMYVHTKKPAVVNFYLNDRLIGEATSEMHREDVEKMLGVSCAFYFTIPEEIQLNPGDKIRARVAGEVIDLDGSPLLL